MIVICKKETKKLVKGLKYEATEVYGGLTRFFIRIKDIGTYTINNFSDVNGNPIPKVLFRNVSVVQNRFLKFEDLKEGDVLVCKNDRYKHFIKDKMYRISELKTTSSDVVGYAGKVYKSIRNFILFEGNNRFLKFNSWSFRKLDNSESRDISLRSLLDNEEASYAVDKSLRRLDLVENKYLTLLEVLSRSILDSNRHHLDIIDWACIKSSGNTGVKKSDYDELLNMSLREILDKIQKK